MNKDKDIKVGPGDYDTSGKVGAFPVYKFKQSAAFSSKVDRQSSYALETEREARKNNKKNNITSMLRTAMENRKALSDEDSESSSDDDNPGPGAYQTQKQSDFYVEPTPERLQFFGSKADRFQQSVGRKVDTNVGPGMYDYANKTAIVDKKGKKVPFACGDMRFRKKKLEVNPGPGAYKAHTIVGDLNMKTQGKKGIFGSSEKRFVINKRQIDQEVEPGPATYDSIQSMKALERKKHANLKKSASMFLSKTKREVNKPAADPKDLRPEPYNPQNNTIAHNVRQKVNKVPGLILSTSSKDPAAFSTRGPRFRKSKVDENEQFLGPGYYESKEQWKNKVNGAPTFKSKSDRFDKTTGFNKQRKEMPGPGAYQAGEGNWNKQSFNMIFGD